MKKQTSFIFFVILIFFISCVEKKDSNFHPELFGDNFGKDIEYCDKQHPTIMYEKAGESFKNREYNRAGFFFYLGRVRYQYYISTNPDVEVDGDQAVFASLNSVFGSQINPYLIKNSDEFIQILNAVIEWCEANDYKFYSKNNSLENYNSSITQLKELKKELEKK